MHTYVSFVTVRLWIHPPLTWAIIGSFVRVGCSRGGKHTWKTTAMTAYVHCFKCFKCFVNAACVLIKRPFPAEFVSVLVTCGLGPISLNSSSIWPTFNASQQSFVGSGRGTLTFLYLRHTVWFFSIVYTLELVVLLFLSHLMNPVSGRCWRCHL